MNVLSSRSKAVFALATALTGAAAVDPIVERMSNGGLFGAGAFTDHSNLDVVPAFVVAFVLSVVFVIGVARRALVRRCYAPQWLRSSASEIDRNVLRGNLPEVFGLQV